MFLIFLFLVQLIKPDSLPVFVFKTEVFVKADRLLEQKSDRNWVWTLPQDSMRQNVGGQTAQTLFATLPGVFVADRENLSVGERIQVRGSGWRSNFGVRGLHVRYNGFPLTMPDGQTNLSILDPDLISDVQFSPVSNGLFWGSSSNGVLVLGDRIMEDSKGTAMIQGGSFGFSKVMTRFNLPTEKGSINAQFSGLMNDGFRENSRSEIARYSISETKTTAKHLRTWMVLGEKAFTLENPGALTESEWNTNPTQANPGFKRANARKANAQLMTGLKQEGRNYHGGVWFLVRALDNPLPFANIVLDRQAGGFWANYSDSIGNIKISGGADFAMQSDDRNEYAVRNAIPTDSLLLEQNEQFISGGLYLRAAYDVGRFSITPGLRFSPSFVRINPAVGTRQTEKNQPFLPQVQLMYAVKNGSFFAGYFTSFDTPTLNEWSSPETAETNGPPSPERSKTVEAGFQISGNRFFLRISAYQMTIKNRIGSFESAVQPGLILYRNEGSTNHKGVELSSISRLGKTWTWSQSFSAGQFLFKEGLLDGKNLPGIPQFTAATSLNGSLFGWFVRANWNGATQRWVNSTNVIKTSGYHLLSASVSRTIPFGNSRTFTPFMSIQNALDERASASVAVNGANGRFYEPSAPRNFRIGISASW